MGPDSPQPLLDLKGLPLYERVRPLSPGTQAYADVLMAIHFARWLETAFSTLPENERAPLLEPAQRMVDWIVKWCAA